LTRRELELFVAWVDLFAKKGMEVAFLCFQMITANQYESISKLSFLVY